MDKFDIEVALGKAWLRWEAGNISDETYRHMRNVFTLEYFYL